MPYSPLGQGFFGGKAVVEAIPANSIVATVSYIYPISYALLLSSLQFVSNSCCVIMMISYLANQSVDQGWFPRLQGDNLEKNKVLYTKIQKLAEKRGCSPAQLALAWVLSQGDGVVPIPGVCRSPS